DAVHRVAAAVEHEVLAKGRLLEADWIAEAAGDMCRNAAARPQHLGCERGQRCRSRDEQVKDEKRAPDLLIPRGVANRLQNICGLRKDYFLEVGTIGNRSVERADAANRRIEMLEQLA